MNSRGAPQYIRTNNKQLQSMRQGVKQSPRMEMRIV